MKKQQNSDNCVANPLHVNYNLQHGGAPCANDTRGGNDPCSNLCWVNGTQKVHVSADPAISCNQQEATCVLPNSGQTCSDLMKSLNTTCNPITNENDCVIQPPKGSPIPFQQCIWTGPSPPPPPPPPPGPKPPGPKPPGPPPGPKPPPSYIGPMIIIALIMILLGGVGIYFMFPKTK